MNNPSAIAGRTIGVDIGGANLKLADSSGASIACCFPMWTRAEELALRLKSLRASLHQQTGQDYTQAAITMTGEMADCFETRAAGVTAIIEQVETAFPNTPIQVYSVDGQWRTPRQAIEQPWEVAASNWHALASWIGRAIATQNDAIRIVLDIGSTTVDVIPMRHGRVATAARCDSDRLRMQQLLYTGIGRTPIATILPAATFDGNVWPLVAECFATSDDAYVALGLTTGDMDGDVDQLDNGIDFTTPEQSNRSTKRYDTADGRPRTIYHAQTRLARMLGEDLQRLSPDMIVSLARQVVDMQAQRVAQAIAHNLREYSALSGQTSRVTSRVTSRSQSQHREPVESVSTPPTIMISGHGRYLAEAALRRLSQTTCNLFLEEYLSPSAARCAPAVAVAWLWEQNVIHRPVETLTSLAR